MRYGVSSPLTNSSTRRVLVVYQPQPEQQLHHLSEELVAPILWNRVARETIIQFEQLGREPIRSRADHGPDGREEE